MSLLTPAFLVAGLLATIVPIVIFLLWKQRRNPIRWAAMRFVLEAERRSRTRRNVEKWLLLAIRCLALALLGFALARPRAGGLDLLGSANMATIVVIDDAMTAGLSAPRGDGTTGTVLDVHRDAVLDVVAAAPAGTRFGLISASRAVPDLLPPTSDPETVRRWLDDLRPRGVQADLPAAIRVAGRAATEATNEGLRPSIHLRSEFRVGSADLQQALGDLALDDSVPLIATAPAADLRSNVTVAGIDPVRSVIIPGAADGSNQVSVRLIRHGDLAAAETRLTVSAPGLPVIEPRTVQWSPGETQRSVELRLPVDPRDAGAIELTAAVESDDLPADDARAVILETAPSLRVALVGRSGFGDRTIDRLSAVDWMTRALAPAEGAGIQIVRFEPATLGPPDLRDIEMAIVPSPDLLRPAGWESLADFARRGGTVLITPPDDAQIHQWVDPFVGAFDLAWRIDRGTDVPVQSLGVGTPPTVSAVLSMLSADLEDLLRPVFVDRRLNVEVDEATEVVLRTEDDQPWLVAAWASSESDDRRAAVSSLDESAADTGTESAADDADEAGEVRGLVLLLATAPSLDWTNLPSKPLMVPLVHELVRQGVGLGRRDATVAVGSRPRLSRFAAADRLVAADINGADDFGPIPVGADGRPADPLPVAGVYEVVDASGAFVGALAVAVESTAGRTETQSPEAVDAWLARSGDWDIVDVAEAEGFAGAGDTPAGFAVPLLIILALLLLAETLLARRFSHVIEGAGSGGISRGSLLPSLTLHSMAAETTPERRS